MAITGGPPVTIAPVTARPRGATWGPDGTIIFATGAPATGLQRVSAAGGEPTVLTKPDRERGEGDHVWPEFLPGGEAVLFTITPATGGIENAQIAVLDLQTGTSKVLIRGGSHAHYVPTGHLVYGVAGTLRAVAVRPRTAGGGGTPAPVLEGVVTTGMGAADFAVAANGSLVYVPGRPVALAGRPSCRWIARDVLHRCPASRRTRTATSGYRPMARGSHWRPRTDVSTYDLARATLSRLTTDPASDRSPLWTPDGQRIIFRSTRAGYPELFWRPADGTGRDQQLLAGAKEDTE